MIDHHYRRWLPQTRGRHRRLVKNLRASDRRGDSRLADILDDCTDDRPCNSGACPLCGLDFQHALYRLYEQTIKAPALRDVRGRISRLNVVPAVGIVGPDDLTADVCARVSADLAAALDAARIPPALCTLDISFNDDLTGRVPPHWCVHAHGPTYNWISERQEAALRKRFPPSELAKRPVFVEELDKNPDGPLYAFKPNRVRRESDVVPAVEGGRKARRDTHRRALRPWQSLAVARVEHEVGYRGRLINHEIDAVAVKQVLDAFAWARDGP